MNQKKGILILALALIAFSLVAGFLSSPPKGTVFKNSFYVPRNRQSQHVTDSIYGIDIAP